MPTSSRDIANFFGINFYYTEYHTKINGPRLVWEVAFTALTWFNLGNEPTSVGSYKKWVQRTSIRKHSLVPSSARDSSIFSSLLLLWGMCSGLIRGKWRQQDDLPGGRKVLRVAQQLLALMLTAMKSWQRRGDDNSAFVVLSGHCCYRYLSWQISYHCGY